MKKSVIFEITISGVMAALAIVLDRFGSINVGVKITLYGLPLMLVGIMFGVKIGFLTGLASGIVIQLTSPYGVGPTSIFWALAPIAWGTISALMYKVFKKANIWISISLTVLITSLTANILNTCAMYMDSLLVKDSYYTLSKILLEWPPRILAAFVSMIPYTILLVLITYRLRFINNENDSKK